MDAYGEDVDGDKAESIGAGFEAREGGGVDYYETSEGEVDGCCEEGGAETEGDEIALFVISPILLGDTRDLEAHAARKIICAEKDLQKENTNVKRILSYRDAARIT